ELVLKRGPDATDAPNHFLTVVADKDASIRLRLVQQLGQFGPAAIAALPAIVQALSDSDSSIALAAGAALLKLGEPPAAGKALLLSALKSPNAFARVSVLAALANLGEETAYWGELVHLLDHDDDLVRRAAAGFFEHCKPDALKRVAPQLEREA